MRRTVMLVGLLLLLSSVQDVLVACGDKFFLVGRGDRFSRAYNSLHPGNVLVYTGGTSQISRGLLADARLHRFMSRAGHRVLVASNRAELDAVLRSNPVDVVLSDLLQAVDLLPHVAAASSQPMLLPIAAAGMRPASTDQFKVTLKSTDKVNRFLSEIENAMESRAKARRAS